MADDLTEGAVSEGLSERVLAVDRQGYIKALHPTYGFITADTGEDLMFIPTAVDATVARFKTLHVNDVVQFDIVQHPRGLRARQVRRLGAA